MKLLLCSMAPWSSTHLQEAFLSLIKPTNENRILILSIDTTSQLHRESLKIAKQWYQRQGFTEENIAIHNLSTDTIPNLEGLDVLHMCGGNTFHIMKRIREIGLMHEIRDFVERDGVYIGSSAGGMIMCPDIDERLTIDINHVGLEDVSGFGYVDFYIVPHWNSKAKDIRERFETYSRKSGKHLIPLTDEQGIVVLDNGYEII